VTRDFAAQLRVKFSHTVEPRGQETELYRLRIWAEDSESYQFELSGVSTLDDYTFGHGEPLFVHQTYEDGETGNVVVYRNPLLYFWRKLRGQR